MTTVSATALARRTREILDEVIMRGEAIAIERNSQIIAQIVPAQRPMTAVQALAGLRPILRPEQGQNWLRDSRGDFDESIGDPWA
jgi:antitoxin (DNA-binding transcriptional repressor) of toxin-antitoxin stability system